MPSVTANISNELALTNSDLIGQFLTAIQNDIRERAKASGKNVSGKTLNSMRVEAKNNYGSLRAVAYFSVLEDGRGPTKNSTPGNPTVKEQLLSWLRSRSIALPPGFASLEALAYVMARSIHKYGDKLYQRGGKSGVISGAITNERTTAFVSALGDRYRTTIASNIVKLSS